MAKNRNKRERYVRLGQVSLEEVKRHYSIHPGEPLTAHGASVRTGSLRMTTFLTKGTDCITCGAKGQYFAVERCWSSAPDSTPHMNLWAVSNTGHEVLMTHDHTIARSLGGADDISNSQPMCESCNSRKSVGEQNTLFALQGVPVTTKRERAAIKRQEQIDKMLTDPTYRATVEFHQKRLGKNTFPEVFGSCKNEIPRVE